MAAIYGALYSDADATFDSINKMKSGYINCKIDKYDDIVNGPLMMGCGHVYSTVESVNEKLPVEDDEYIYTADVIIDNRNELIKELDAPKDITDGALLYLSFLKWKEKIGNHVIGIFSASFYNKTSKEIWLFTDQTSSRCINYYVSDEGFFFSTMITPILKVVKNKIALNEKWIACCQSNCSADLLFDAENTAFEGVYQLEAGHCIHYHNGKVTRIKYFDPMSLYKKIHVSDESGFELFRNKFSQCIEEMLRSNGEVGITLSSGLDSSSVACTAAPILAKKSKNLYSYTSIPIEGYENDDDFLVANEEEGVRRLGQQLPNLKMEFVDCPSKNAYSDLKTLIPVLECPYKSSVNLVWIDEIYKKARENNIRIVLKGQYGNSTISYGTLMTTVYQLFLSGHWLKCVKEINRFGAINRISRKNILKVIKMAYDDNRKKESVTLDEAFTKDELLTKYNVLNIINQLGKNEANTWIDKQSERFNSMWSPRILAHLGAFDTKLGLKAGIVVRDPTKDIRIIALCMNLPITCFGGGGLERRLVREGMKGVVPEFIRLDKNHRGWQGADFEYRMSKVWDDIKTEIISQIGSEKLDRYLDREKLNQLSEILKEEGMDSKADNRASVKMMVVLALSEFLDVFEER